MVCSGLQSIHLHYFCVEYFQVMNTLIKRKEKVDVNLLCKCNACLLFHFCLSHMTFSLPEVPQWPESPLQEACVFMGRHPGRSWHQKENVIMNWHCADLRCLARQKRYFKTLELSAEHLTGRSHYAASCLSTSPLDLPALALFLGDLSTNELSCQFYFLNPGPLGNTKERSDWPRDLAACKCLQYANQ